MSTGGDSGGAFETDGGAHVQIGTVSGGSQAFGAHGKAESTNYTVVTAEPGYAQLLTAVRTLRTELGQQQEHTAESEALGAELAVVEGEIARTGRSGHGPLTRLRARLEAYGPAAATAASVTAVTQAITQLLQR
ncbi:hypothetical protein [Streptomyces sporangiiformans]|uniref:Uncharacterized protein n=1 Tax=Streptomyces sporangiiformans TaxID=2315329 RepID=A0A505DMP0_9ACTN|nr:hypothetical protein [Streptomyces sporangiiformans]TPQ21819.1 hypothetical protein FGD71_013040 [Streptomyces sporangiiformans]